MTGKSNRQLDREAFQPRGEATHVPDRYLESRHGSHDRLADRGYPSAGESASTACRGCGQSIPENQRKCATCLEDHIEPGDTNGDTRRASPRFPRVIFAVVEARCDFTALAKGAAACTLLEQRDANSLEECQLIDDVGETPTTALRGTWGDLPPAVRITSERGSQLLSVALKHTDCADGDRDSREEAEQSLPRLYDERGTGILNEEQVEPEADPGDSDRWLVPILGAERKSADDHTTERKILGQTAERIHCRCCEGATEHRFSGYEQLSEETRDGSPIWHCHDCGTPRFGPTPE